MNKTNQVDRLWHKLIEHNAVAMLSDLQILISSFCV